MRSVARQLAHGHRPSHRQISVSPSAVFHICVLSLLQSMTERRRRPLLVKSHSSRLTLFIRCLSVNLVDEQCATFTGIPTRITCQHDTAATWGFSAACSDSENVNDAAIAPCMHGSATIRRLPICTLFCTDRQRMRFRGRAAIHRH